MPKKDTHRRIGSTSSSASSDHGQGTTADPSPALSSLTPKPCLTCGRVITPRAKWAKNWTEIKYCSDRCRSTKPGKVLAIWTVPLRPETDRVAVEKGTLLEGLVRYEEAEDGRTASLDVETWVEEVIVKEAAHPSAKKGHAVGTKAGSKNGKKGDALASLEDAESRLVSEAIALIKASEGPEQPEDAAHTSTRWESQEGHETGDKSPDRPTLPQAVAHHPLWKALDSPPGLRERVRRAARRLALGIAHHSTLPDPHRRDASVVDRDPGPAVELLQRGKVLQTLKDYSFAKGPLSIRTPTK